MRPLSRRAVLLGGASALVLAACGGGGRDDDDDGAAAGDDSPSSTTTSAGGGLAIARVFSPTQPVGKQVRLPLALASADGAILPADDAPASLSVRWSREGGGAGERVEITRRADGIPTPYFPLVATFPEPGTYRIEVEAGRRSAATTVDVVPVEDAPFVPGPGDALVAVATPTTEEPRGVDPICTREPRCPFHAEPLGSAIGNGKALALLISTPAFCQTAICGPVLDLLVDRAEQHAEVLTVVHAEVYTDERARTTTETVKAYGLSYEPALFLAAPDGTIDVRLDYTFDGSELDEALSRLVQ